MYEIALTGNLQGTVTGTGTLQTLCACYHKATAHYCSTLKAAWVPEQSCTKR